MTIKVSAICTADQTRDMLVSSIATLPDIVFNAHSGSINTLTSVLKKDQPDVMLLELPFYSDSVMAQLDNALLDAPETHLVLVSPERSVEFLMRAMRSGVRAVLPAPLTSVSVQEAIKHEHEHRRGFHEQNELGRVLAMVPAKGGAGGTFLATNLAFALSRQGKRVAVLDLNMYFGDAAIFLGNISPKSTIVDLAHKEADMDRELLESSMVKISDRLHILMAPESLEYVREISPEFVQKVIELARSCYDFVVLDVSSMLDPVTIKALDLSNSIYLVLQLNLPFVRAAKRMVETFRELGYANGKLNIVVNRHETEGDVGLADVEKATLLDVNQTIPNSHVAVTASINQGVPLLELAPRDPVAHALQEWAQELAPIPQKKIEGGWLHNLMRRSS